MKRILGEVISFVFHPVLLALFMPFLIVYRQTDSGMYALKWEIFSFLFAGVALLFFIIARAKGYIKDLDFSNSKERYKFYGTMLPITMLYIIVAIYLKGMFFSLSIVSFGIGLGFVLFAFVNYFVKASIHIGVACAYVLTVAYLYGPMSVLFTFWIIPLLAWARLTLKKHKPLEIFTGGMLGSGITIFTLYLAKVVSHN